MTISPASVAVSTPVNYTNPSPGAEPLNESLAESSIHMVDSLTLNILESAEHNDCGQEVAALIDIATYRNVDADAASRRAEQRLLSLFAAPSLPSVRQQQIIDRLFEAEAILVQGKSPDAEAFSMPASLKHLMAQYAHRQMASEEVTAVTDTVHLEEIKIRLNEASGLNDEMNIADPNRFVTTDEMSASFAELPGTHPEVINLSGGVDAEAAQMQMQRLLDDVPDAGVILAPLLVDDHFMLIAAEKSVAPGKYALTIANTYLPISQAAIEALSITQHEDCQAAIAVPSTAPRVTPNFILGLKHAAAERFTEQLFRKISPAFAGKVNELKVLNNHLQAHAINSCGPLVSIMAGKILMHKSRGREVGVLMQRMSDEWRRLEPQQQQDAVMAHRAKMIGHTVEWHRCGLPDGDRFMDSHAFLPRETT